MKQDFKVRTHERTKARTENRPFTPSPLRPFARPPVHPFTRSCVRLAIYIFLLFFPVIVAAQPGNRGIRPRLNATPQTQPDSLVYVETDTSKISTSNTRVFRLTDKLSERYLAPMDTQRLNFSNSVLLEGRGPAVSYLANIGSPAQSRIFSERGEENDFIFADAYNYYLITPQNALFYDVKEPYTHLTYLPNLIGNKQNSEEMFKGVLTSNFGKKLNIGIDFDYTFVRGHYASNSNKSLCFRPFGCFLSDRYEVHAYFQGYDFLNSENGGITNDRYITHPDDFTEGRRPINDTKSFPTRFTDTWNHFKGKQVFLTHRYNLGFYRELTEKEKEEAEKRKEENKRKKEQQGDIGDVAGNRVADNMQQSGLFPEETTGEPVENETPDAVFVPVSSIIHTFEYEGRNRLFLSNSNAIDTCYQQINTPIDSALYDFTEAWNIKNTIGLALREGFQDWAKFGLTAFVHLEKRRFSLPDDSARTTFRFDEFSTYLGADLSKQQGQLLTYKARGEFCLAGSDLGEFRLEGELKTQFMLAGKEASVKATGFIKNLTPAFYARHHHARYYWWDNPFKKTQRVYLGGEVDLRQTRTKMTAGVESIQNFVYFGKTGIPEQFESNLQVITARIKQDFRFKALGWENEIVYQISSDKNVLPLPQLSAYSNLYIDFTYAHVLNIQLGVDAHYFTSYYAPYYEPATQQFQTQDEKKIGNYPIINAYVNLRLKQTRFFISGYNLGSLLIAPTEYFSLLHYPLNPMIIKAGISFYLNN